jgi:hypothetical protein
MKRFTIIMGVIAMVVASAAFSSPAQAGDFGLHFAGRGYHIDVGHAHHGHDYYDGYRTARYGYGGHGCYTGRSVWHDTSHWDYHPGEYVRHRNHYHYVPGHYDFHDDGHWDHYGW